VGGQDQWKGKVIRIAHLGYVDTFNTVIAMSALEMVLSKFGVSVEFGKGVGGGCSGNFIGRLLNLIQFYQIMKPCRFLKFRKLYSLTILNLIKSLFLIVF
jgi:hypothetical protein